MNELQQAICDKFSLVEVPPKFIEDLDSATHVLTPQGRLYELDSDRDLKLPAGTDSFHYITSSQSVIEFLQNLGVVWVQHTLKIHQLGVPIEV